MIRAVARITASRGQGRGAALGIVRLRLFADGEEGLRAVLREKLDPRQLDGIISMHLIESDPALSKPITDDPLVPNPGSGDWYVLIDGTHIDAISATLTTHFAAAAFTSATVISTGVYNLMWDLAKSDIPPSHT
jgi:hypothetical protein